MPFFVALGRATNDGMKNLEAFAPRHKKAVERAEASGVKVLASYAVVGRYDYIVILEAPDTKAAVKVLTLEAAGGNVRYETMAAVPIEEFGDLLGI